jgi:DNA-binding transcriptional ArsR family regulator
VSDLGQLLAFNDSVNIQLLRVLQREKATIEGLANALEEPVDTVSRHLRALTSLGLVREVGKDTAAEGTVYRATARIYDLQPEPRDNALVMAPVANATLDAVRHDVVSSLRQWPDQTMNFESRRLRMSKTRAMEFNDRLNELLGEYWGNPDHPVKDDPDEPVMAFAGIWYRFPDQSGN